MQERNDLKFDKSTAVKAYINFAAVLIIIILSLAIFSNSMTKSPGHDEQMYSTGAYMMAQGKMIYRDFSYVTQLPYHPLLLAAAYKLTGTTHYLLTGRLISSICDILVMIIIFGIFRRIFKSHAVTGTLLGIAAAIIYVFNPLVDYANGYAWNHDVVILCVMLALFLFILTDFKKNSSFWLIVMMGALLTFATFMRITTALIAVLFFVILLTIPAASIMLRLKRILPFLAGSCLALIWPIWLIANAPRAFYLNIFKMSVLNGRLARESGVILDKMDLTMTSLTTPGYFALAAFAIYLWLIFIFLLRHFEIKDKSKVILVALLPLFFFAIALIPPAMWPQYLAMPVPFILTSLAFPLFYLKTSRKLYNIAIVFIIICVTVSVASYPFVLYRIPAVLTPEVWTPIKLHGLSKDIADEISEPKLVMTLAPLYAIEGGCEIYNELSAGPFAYRVADYLSPEERKITHTVGTKNISELISEKPPSALITGADTETLEKPILNSIKGLNWRRKEYKTGLTVYFNPMAN